MRRLTRLATMLFTASAAVSLTLTGTASAQEVTGIEEDAQITMIGPDGQHYPAPGAVSERGNGQPPGDMQIQSWNSCTRYEQLLVNADRHACLRIDGAGLWSNYQQVWFDPSRYGSDNYTYVNARFNVDRPNGSYAWGTNGGWVNIMGGYNVRVPINNFIDAGNWCLRFQLQRTNGVWENWRETCGPVWA